MDILGEEFFKLKEFDIEQYIKSLGDINSMSAFELLNKIKNLREDNRKQLLENDFIRDKLKYGLLYESKNDQWYFYRKVVNSIGVVDFLSLYDYTFLSRYFISSQYGEKIYKFYASLCEKDVNAVVKYVLNDKNFYEDFFMNSADFSSYFSQLNYDLVRQVILKKQDDGYKLDESFLRGIDEEKGYLIIDDPVFSDETIISILPFLNNKNKSYFFENDVRAIYLYDKFNLEYLIDKGIVFNDNILKKNDFFNLIKKDSFVEFRNLINKLEAKNNPIIIEDRLDAYYDEIISGYDKENDMFGLYYDVLENPNKHQMSNSYIYDFEVAYYLGNSKVTAADGFCFYHDKEKLSQFLKKKTSIKLSEVIIDALFRDNIYNVWININEMLRYNQMFEINKRIIDDKRLAFYNMILNFDKLDNPKKINLYNELKGKNFSLIFYEDLRRTKDSAYNEMKNRLINPSLCPEYIDNTLSNKHNVNVYDLRDRNFLMLVRTQACYRDVVHYKRGCYSIISDKNNQVFGESSGGTFLYGYNSFDNDMVLHVFERDSYSTNFKDQSSRFVNRIMTPEQLVSANNSYNEIQILNKKSSAGTYKWDAKKPDFIVVYNVVRETHVEEARRLGIPIVIISKKILDKEDIVEIDNNSFGDTYVTNYLDESEYRIKR